MRLFHGLASESHEHLRLPANWRVFASQLTPVAVLLALVAVVTYGDPAFLGFQSLTTVADESSVLLVLAAGETLVILAGGIDLSIAALTSLSTVLLARGLPAVGWVAVPIVLIATTLAGAVQGYVHVRAQIPSFVVTLGGLALWSGIALTAANASNIPVGTGYDAVGWAFGSFAGLPSAFLLALLVLVALGAALHWLPVGRWIYATGNAEPATLMSGIQVGRAKVLVFAASGLCTGLAGVLLVARSYNGGPTLAASLLLPTIAAVVVGGTAITGGFGGMGRTLIGALIITLLRVGLGIMGIDPAIEPIAYGLVLICAVALTIDRSKLLVVK